MSSPPRPGFSFLLLDLDDTTIPWHTAAHWQWAFRPQGPVLGERKVESAVRKSLKAWDRRRWRGLTGAEPPAGLADLKAHLAVSLGAIAGHPLPETEVAAVLQRFLHPAGEIETFPDVRPAIEKWTAQGLNVGIVTALPADSARWNLHRAGLPESLLVLAGDTPGVVSLPSKEAFRWAVQAVGGSDSDGLFLGDLFWSDVRAAGRAGLSSVLTDRADRTPEVAARRIHSFSEVDAVLAATPPPPEAKAIAESTERPAEE